LDCDFTEFSNDCWHLCDVRWFFIIDRGLVMKADIQKLINDLENIPCDIDSMIVTIGNSQDKDEWDEVLNTPENMKKERLMEALDQVQIYWDSSLQDAFDEMT